MSSVSVSLDVTAMSPLHHSIPCYYGMIYLIVPMGLKTYPNIRVSVVLIHRVTRTVINISIEL